MLRERLSAARRGENSRTAPIPCVVRTEFLAEEDPLAENLQRAPLHPLDQAHLKMSEMVERAQELLTGSGSLPEPLRTPGQAAGATALTVETSPTSPTDAAGEESTAAGYETAMANLARPAEDESAAAEHPPVAAE